MKIEVKFQGSNLSDIAGRYERFGRDAAVEGARELNVAGETLRKGLVGVLAAQTGLKQLTLNRALKGSKAQAANPVYEILATGGDISLKYFGARETAAGVSAAPWGRRQVYGGTFMKAGWWPHRVAKPNWNAQVFKRAGGQTKTGMDQFIKVKSGLFIAEELVKGEAAKFFEEARPRWAP